jgi:hypothetical protein
MSTLQFEASPRFQRLWRKEPPERRRADMALVKKELLYAVSSYIGNDLPLLDALW